MEILKPICSGTVLMGMHTTCPLMEILIDTYIKYSTIMAVFQKLYKDQVTLKPHHFLQTSECVVLYQPRYLSKQLQKILLIVV